VAGWERAWPRAGGAWRDSADAGIDRATHYATSIRWAISALAWRGKPLAGGQDDETCH
jgi:hypothetical protein